MNKGILIFGILGILLVGGVLFMRRDTAEKVATNTTSENAKIRYVALGDSLTSGLGVTEQESWPSLLTEHLREDGYDIEFVENLAVSGYTAEDVLTYQIPELRSLNPTFITLFIGTNDLAFRIPSETYREHLSKILNEALAVLPDKKKLLLVTIPDFSYSPQGKLLRQQEEIQAITQEYNKVIQEEAEKRDLVTVDLYEVTRNLDTTYYIYDGFHPSGKQYKIWEEIIYEKVQQILAN